MQKYFLFCFTHGNVLHHNSFETMMAVFVFDNELSFCVKFSNFSKRIHMKNQLQRPSFFKKYFSSKEKSLNFFRVHMLSFDNPHCIIDYQPCRPSTNIIRALKIEQSLLNPLQYHSVL